MSIGQIWVVAGPEDQINTMEAGWRVSLIYWISLQRLNIGFYFFECKSKLWGD